MLGGRRALHRLDDAKLIEMLHKAEAIGNVFAPITEVHFFSQLDGALIILVDRSRPTLSKSELRSQPASPDHFLGSRTVGIQLGFARGSSNHRG